MMDYHSTGFLTDDFDVTNHYVFRGKHYRFSSDHESDAQEMELNQRNATSGNSRSFQFLAL